MAKIMIVEDDAAIAHAYELELKRAGYQVDLATDGAEALDMLTPEHELIILDILMPNIDGIEFMQRAINHQQGRVPKVIVLSNVDTPALQAAAQEMGARQFYLKVNIIPSQLVDIVADNLRQ
jgi:DNA-binding response OmpR family regulator